MKLQEAEAMTSDFKITSSHLQMPVCISNGIALLSLTKTHTVHVLVLHTQPIHHILANTGYFILKTIDASEEIQIQTTYYNNKEEHTYNCSRSACIQTYLLFLHNKLVLQHRLLHALHPRHFNIKQHTQSMDLL